MDKCPEHGSYISPLTKCPQCAKEEEEWIAEQAEREQKRALQHVNRKLRRIERKQKWHSTMFYLLLIFLVILPMFTKGV